MEGANNKKKIVTLFQENNIFGTSASLTHGIRLQNAVDDVK